MAFNTEIDILHGSIYQYFDDPQAYHGLIEIKQYDPCVGSPVFFSIPIYLRLLYTNGQYAVVFSEKDNPTFAGTEFEIMEVSDNPRYAAEVVASKFVSLSECYREGDIALTASGRKLRDAFGSIFLGHTQTWYEGTGKPSPESGTSGDCYLDTSTRNVYIRGESDWHLSVNLGCLCDHSCGSCGEEG